MMMMMKATYNYTHARRRVVNVVLRCPERELEEGRRFFSVPRRPDRWYLTDVRPLCLCMNIGVAAPYSRRQCC